MRNEIAAIAAQSPDPRIRAEAALSLVQDRVRYVFLGMNDGGLLPADAETTWQRRFGDCKGKTVLLLTLLRGLGIAADPVIVSTGGGNGLDRRLPMIALFDHVLVRATIAGRTYWLDGTRTGDKALDSIITPNFTWGLPLVPGATLVRMTAPQLSKPETETELRIDATAGITIPAPTHVETVLRDDAAIVIHQELANLSAEALERGLRQYWRKQYDFIEAKTVTASFDPAKREERLVMDGLATMDWSTGWYETDGVGVGYRADFSRDPGPDRDAPFALSYPEFTRTSEIVLLPPGAFTISHGEPIDRTVAGTEYHRKTSLAGNRFTVEESERSVAAEVPAPEAIAAQATLRDMADKDVFIGRPDNYAMTDQELAGAMHTPPTTADGFVDRGNTLLDRFRLDEAIADFSGAITLDPKDAMAYADRGFAHAWKQDLSAAASDFDTAEKIDPKNAVVFRGRGLLAEMRGLTSDAVAAYSRSLELDPESSFAFERRAAVYHRIGDDAHAIADAAAVIRMAPPSPNMHLLRANAFRRQGRVEEALHEAAAVVEANPDGAFSHVVAARIYGRFGRQADAEHEFAAALKIEPAAAYIYLNHAAARRRDDYAGRQADLDAAAKIEPRSTELFASQAVLQEDRKDFADAVVSWTASLAISPKDVYALVSRGIDHDRLGHAALASTDFAAARALAKDADGQLILCRAKAAAGIALAQALDECDAGLALAPTAVELLDNLGLVQLRLGHFGEAAAAYRKALAQAPTRASSFYGLALAEARAGETAQANEARQQAIKADPDIASDYERYDVSFPADEAARAGLPAS